MLIATHNGNFHADEVTACVIFSLLYSEIKIIRTRDREKMETADYVIDVSGKFDLVKHYDHHPAEFALARPNGIRYATSGLIWKKFGVTLLKKIADENNINNIDQNILESSCQKIDSLMMEYIDLCDNGQLDSYTKQIANPTTPAENKLFNNLNGFYMNTPNIPFIVAMQNINSEDDEAQMKAFTTTVECLKPLIKNVLIQNIINERDIKQVLKSYDGSEILWLNSKLPWKQAVFDNWDKFTKCMITVYPDAHHKGWRIQSLPKSKTSFFLNRKNAPLAWRGKEDEELNKLIGISSATFVHRTGFTGGAQNIEDIRKMANEWLKNGLEN